MQETLFNLVNLVSVEYTFFLCESLESKRSLSYRGEWKTLFFVRCLHEVVVYKKDWFTLSSMVISSVLVSIPGFLAFDVVKLECKCSNLLAFCKKAE